MAFAKVFFPIIIVAYPFIVYFGLDHLEARTIATLLIGLGVLRLMLLKRVGSWTINIIQAKWMVVALLAICCLVIVFNSADLLKFYPLFVNISMFIIFFASLWHPPTVIERIARLQTPDLPDAGVRYTRKVTIVWCGFFILNGGMALYTSVATDVTFWVVYNGLISYMIMGILFIGEYAVRYKLQPNIPRHNQLK